MLGSSAASHARPAPSMQRSSDMPVPCRRRRRTDQAEEERQPCASPAVCQAASVPFTLGTDYSPLQQPAASLSAAPAPANLTYAPTACASALPAYITAPQLPSSARAAPSSAPHPAAVPSVDAYQMPPATADGQVRAILDYAALRTLLPASLGSCMLLAQMAPGRLSTCTQQLVMPRLRHACFCDAAGNGPCCRKWPVLIVQCKLDLLDHCITPPQILNVAACMQINSFDTAMQLMGHMPNQHGMHAAAAPAGTPYQPATFVSRLSVKLFNCTPHDLPPDLRDQLTSWLHSTPAGAEGVLSTE